MGVNAAAFTHYFLRQQEKKVSNFITPILGFLVCFVLWLSLSAPAKIAGVVWMSAGIAYGAYRTRGFRSELVNFDIPEEESS
jgi:putrescine importer